jgi:hypothetical protein
MNVEPRRHAGREEPTPRITGSVELHSDATIDVRMTTVKLGDVMSGMRLADEPFLRGASLSLGCAPPAPSGPHVAQCAEAVAHRAALTASTRSELDELLRDGGVTRCAEAELPASYFSCMTGAMTTAAAQQCDQQLPADKQSLYLGGPACGSRELALQVRVPLPLIESLKLLEIVDLRQIPDCRTPHTSPPMRFKIGPMVTDGATSVGAVLQLGPSERPWLVDLSPGPAPGATIHPDRRWTTRREFDPQFTQSCLGPFQLAPPLFAWSSPTEACDVSGSSAHGAYRRPPVTTDVVPATRTVKVCRIGPQQQPPELPPTRDCHIFQAAAAIAGISINTRGDHAAIVTGAPAVQFVETWDLTTGKRIARFPAGTTARKPCAHAALLDDTLLLGTGACAGTQDPRLPDGTIPDPDDDRVVVTLLHGLRTSIDTGAQLTTLRGKRIATVGGSASFAAIVSSPIPLGGPRWAFIAAGGDTAVIQDVTTGAVEKRIPTGEAVAPGQLLAAGDGLGHLALAYGGTTPRSGSITVVDIPAGTATSFSLPTCPPGPPGPSP